MFLGIDHIALAARDTRALVDWYREVLGFEVVWMNDKEPPAALIAGPDGAMIEVMPDNGTAPVAHEPNDPGFRHLALRVSNFDAALAHLQARGVAFVGEPGEAGGGGRVLSFLDPEGNVLQIVSRPAGYRAP